MSQTFGNISIEITPTENMKDYFNININGFSLGSVERSEVRFLIQELDNNI